MTRLMTYTGMLALSVVLLAGCGSPKTEKTDEDTTGLPEMPPDTVDMSDSGHPTEGPHHGSLIELGKEEYHAELVHDEKAGTVTIYLLDGPTAKVSVSTDAQDVAINVSHDGKPEQFKLMAQRDQGDPEGKSSRFVSKDSELIEHLDEEGAETRLVVKINGKSFNGKISHSHDHAGHNH